MRRLLISGIALALVTTGCGGSSRPATPTGDDAAVNTVATDYVRLVLALGEHDPGYVDAYYGPAEVRDAVVADLPDLAAIRSRAVALGQRLEALPAEDDQLAALRRVYLERQLSALATRVDMLQGAELSFDQESRRLYDAVAPRVDDAELAAAVDQLDALLPGDGPIPARWDAYRQQFVIPPEHVRAVMQAAIDACRERTLSWLPLPAGESFGLELVHDQPWGAYNWYLGDYRSRIEVNTDLPNYLDRALGLAAHEGYPGHHAYNALLEQHLVRERGWVEFQVYPLYSPQSLIAEGTANAGIELIFPAAERWRFTHDVLGPLAGVGPWDVERHAAIAQARVRLAWAGTEAARRYLDGELDEAGTLDFLRRYALLSSDRARQRLRFIRTYRSYAINYTLGQQLVEDHLDAVAGSDLAARRREFTRLLTTPQVASTLLGTASDTGHVTGG